MTTPREAEAGPTGKQPRTERGRRTLRKLLDAAAIEFAERGFHDTSISGITSRAGTALGSFYTYFDSKDEIFQALVRDLSDRVRVTAGKALTTDLSPLETERAALAAFLAFTRENKEIYRIIDEAEFVDPASHRAHYEAAARRIMDRLGRGIATGAFRDDLREEHAWAIMGMNVFLGLRYCIWSKNEAIENIAESANSILKKGITA